MPSASVMRGARDRTDLAAALRGLRLPPAWAGRRSWFADRARSAQRRIERFAAAHGWGDRGAVYWPNGFEVFDTQARLWCRLRVAYGLPADAPLPTPSLAAALEQGTLMAVTPAVYAAVQPAYGAARGAYARLLAHEMAHRLHIAVLDGDEDAMGPPWFYEGFAVVASGDLTRLAKATKADVWQHVRVSGPGAYARYAAALRFFMARVDLRELVAAAARSDFEAWLRDRMAGRAATRTRERMRGRAAPRSRDRPARRIRVVDYDPTWPARFRGIRDAIAPALDGVASAIEHVGSTAVPGLAAKPIVDVDVVVEDAAAAETAVARLEDLGYRHLGDLGIAGREAFAPPAHDSAPLAGGAPGGALGGVPGAAPGGDHNLYVCLRGGPALENHLRLRDRLRADPALAQAYADLKRELARAHPHDIDAYVAGKTAFVTGVLREAGMAPADLAAIAAANDAG